MSDNRSGYIESDEDGANWAYIMWRGAVKSALGGKRGQEFLVEAARVLDALPEHKLSYAEFEDGEGYCLLGAVGASRGMDISSLDYEDTDGLADKFGVSKAMIREIRSMKMNLVMGNIESGLQQT